MLEMCGVRRLRAALQKLQLEHMLAHHSAVLVKLQAKLAEILPTVEVCASTMNTYTGFWILLGGDQ